MILVFLRSAWSLAKLIPWPVYAIAALVALHFWLVHVRVNQAVDETNASWVTKLAAEKAAYETKLAALREKQQEVITRTVIEYRDRIKIVKEKASEIQNTIQADIQAHSDSHDLLAGWVRRDLDAAARGDVPHDPAGTPGPADPIEVAAVVTVVAENYASCRSDAERLIALQGLVVNLQGVKP